MPLINKYSRAVRSMTSKIENCIIPATKKEAAQQLPFGGKTEFQY